MTRPALSPSLPIRRALLSALAVTLAAGTGSAIADATPRPQAPGDPQIRYEVSGAPGTAEYLTYEIDAGQAHEANVRLPWSKQFSASPSANSFVLSAQGHGPGTLTCRILVDGKVISQATASGDPARTVCVPIRR